MNWYTLILTELLGTAILIILGNGIVANVVLKGTKGNNSGLMPITFGWAMAVTVGALIANALGGVAHFNPTVTVALAIADKSGKLGFGNYTGIAPIGMFVLVLIFQFIGAIIGQLIVNFVYYKHIQKTLQSGSIEDQLSVLAMHSTAPTERNWIFNFAMEFVGTAVLILAILSFGKFIGGNGLPSYYAPVLVGMVILAIGLSLGGTTGYAINPFRDLAPRLVHQLMPFKNKGSSDWKYAWIPVVAPLAAGIIVGAFFLI
ncbi:aquaporin family protein [Mesoplasma chauliocola]|uniref:Aquaporin family protein n=1 Tax=Mesoplasma chauliocola TaxID=216427 RepID=A0A249SP61_9MOLU|nr:MIP/aquaporin family protein [Mesoplasma chauliocola]ASZ09383.1 aquaporin family protein [Mesoplasma chauliocola]